MDSTTTPKVESLINVMSYLQDLKHALDNGATIDFQMKRRVDDNRDIKHTNSFTMATLFPDENPEEALRRELKTLTFKEYLRTVKDTRFPNKSDMWEFGKVYNGTDEVYIKIRVQLLSEQGLGNHTTFVMSFHFAEKPFSQETFPYA